MAARRPFWKWHCWKSIGFCLWPPSTCIWNLKLKFQSKLDLCSGNHVVYRQTDGQTDRRTRWIQYTPPPASLGGGIKKYFAVFITCRTCNTMVCKPSYHVDLCFICRRHRHHCRIRFMSMGNHILQKVCGDCLLFTKWCLWTYCSPRGIRTIASNTISTHLFHG